MKRSGTKRKKTTPSSSPPIGLFAEPHNPDNDHEICIMTVESDGYASYGSNSDEGRPSSKRWQNKRKTKHIFPIPLWAEFAFGNELTSTSQNRILDIFRAVHEPKPYWERSCIRSIDVIPRRVKTAKGLVLNLWSDDVALQKALLRPILSEKRPHVLAAYTKNAVDTSNLLSKAPLLLEKSAFLPVRLVSASVKPFTEKKGDERHRHAVVIDLSDKDVSTLLKWREELDLFELREGLTCVLYTVCDVVDEANAIVLELQKVLPATLYYNGVNVC